MTDRAPRAVPTAAGLARVLRERVAPDDLVQQRLALAARVATEIAGHEPVVAALVVGSTALRRCSPSADLDLVVVTPAAPGDDRFSTRVVDGVRVEVERIGGHRAAVVTAGSGWVWELREAARLGCSVAVLDPGGFAVRLARRAAAMTPSLHRYEEVLRDVYVALTDLAGATGDPARRTDVLRGCVDNLALLALLEHPRRYQKPKWVLADLLHAGEVSLVDAVVAAYGVADDDPVAASAAVAGAGEVVARALELAGAPSHGELLAMGFAPDWAEASYVSRCLDDAVDLAASGRFAEAQYVARFSARLAAGLLGPSAAGGIVDVLAGAGGDDLARRYLALFPGAGAPPPGLLETALAAADSRRRFLESHAVAR